MIGLIKKQGQVPSKIKDVEVVNNIQSVARNMISRTCWEIHMANPSLPSGMHWIDPDGQGVGDDPIRVYCDMATILLIFVSVYIHFCKLYFLILLTIKIL